MAGVHVQWLDNFSKFYAIAVQGLGTGAFADCLWTAAGLHRYVGPFVSTSLQPGVPGTPSSLVSPAVISLFKQKMAVADAVSEGLLKDSVCFRYTVRQLPLKPEVDATTSPALAAVLRESRDGMRIFFPLGMLPENIASNRGLMLLLKDRFGVQPKAGHYSFLSVDCNIYLRVLKVHVTDAWSLILMNVFLLFVLAAVYLRRVRRGHPHGCVALRDVGSVAPLQAGQHSGVEPLGAALPRPFLQPLCPWGQLHWQSPAHHHHHLLHIHTFGCAQLFDAAARRHQSRAP